MLHLASSTDVPHLNASPGQVFGYVMIRRSEHSHIEPKRVETKSILHISNPTRQRSSPQLSGTRARHRSCLAHEPRSHSNAKSNDSEDHLGIAGRLFFRETAPSHIELKSFSRQGTAIALRDGSASRRHGGETDLRHLHAGDTSGHEVVQDDGVPSAALFPLRLLEQLRPRRGGANW